MQVDAKEQAKFQSSYATILRVGVCKRACTSLSCRLLIDCCINALQAYMDNLKKKEKSKSKAAKK